MKKDLLEILICPDCHSRLILITDRETEFGIREGRLNCPHCQTVYPILDYIPRFVTSDKYTRSFSFEWTRHWQTQLDSINGTTESENNLRNNLDFPLEELRDKIVLDAGCGSGRYAEIVLKYGGTLVGFDLSQAIDAAYQNMGHHSKAHFIQADIFHLPFAFDTFDLIYSIGVLHHTPEPQRAFTNLVHYLKPSGKIALKVYARYNKLYVAISEFWRFFTTRLPHRFLYFLSHLAIPAYYFYKIPFLGKIFLGILPMSPHKNWRIRVLDTFDWYSPRYQHYYLNSEVVQWFNQANLKNVKELKSPISFIGQK